MLIKSITGNPSNRKKIILIRQNRYMIIIDNIPWVIDIYWHFDQRLVVARSILWKFPTKGLLVASNHTNHTDIVTAKV